MKRSNWLIVIVLALASASYGQNCVDAAKIVAPTLSSETKTAFETKLNEAQRTYRSKLENAEAQIWVGRRLAYLGRYQEAIRVFGNGAARHADDARFLRHRGHRLITIRCFDEAIKDLEAAANLINRESDQVEPDGLPNAKNTPTSTLQSNIWYHLGLAYYLKGNFAKALGAYREAMKVSKNNDMLAATSHWLYMTLRRLDRKAEAERVLAPFNKDFTVIENADYLKLLRLYRGETKPETLLTEITDKAATLSNASTGYGLGNWFWYSGDKPKAMEIFRKITTGDQWASFGYIAAEADSLRQ